VRRREMRWCHVLRAAGVGKRAGAGKGRAAVAIEAIGSAPVRSTKPSRGKGTTSTSFKQHFRGNKPLHVKKKNIRENVKSIEF
jgi:hypothetical protein